MTKNLKSIAIDTKHDADHVAGSIVPFEIDIRDVDRHGPELAARLGAQLIGTQLRHKISLANLANSVATDAFVDHAESDSGEATVVQPVPVVDLVQEYVDTVAPSMVRAAVEKDHNRDPILTLASELTSTGSAMPKRSGDLLSDMTAASIATHPDMTVLREVPLPVPPGAMAIGKRAVKEKVCKPLPSRDYLPTDYANATYHRVDVVAFDRRTGQLYLIESKRGLGQSDCGQIRRSSSRLKGLAVSVAAGLAVEYGITGVTGVTALVADHYGRSGFRTGLAMYGGTFDDTLGIRGVDETLQRLETCLAVEAKKAMWPVVQRTMSAFLADGFGCNEATALDADLLDAIWHAEECYTAPEATVGDGDGFATVTANNNAVALLSKTKAS